MKYAGRGAFRAMHLRITRGGFNKIFYHGKRPKQEVTFRLSTSGGTGKTVKGTIFTFQQHGSAIIFTIQFPDGFYRFIVGNGHEVWGENEFTEYCSRNGKPPFSQYWEGKPNWPEKPNIDGDWLD